MTAVALPVKALDSRDCKTPGCEGEAHWSRGPFSGLCTRCADRVRPTLAARTRQQMAQESTEQKAERYAKVSATRRSAASIETLAKRLELANRRLRDAQAQQRRAAEAVDAALARLAAARRDGRDA